ncbi:coiled-coil domain-containing protein [Halostella salina]|uniref:coiled-coil domain-containing protein n=1 Tax=Halostella salina TaxID=1547897 RepID=UPI000EF812A4|nr:hypothetical protein [Halostella salina]
MTDTLDTPDKNDSKEDLKQHVDRLQNQIEALEAELETTREENQKLKQDLNEIQDRISARNEEMEHVRSTVQECINRLEGTDWDGTPDTDEMQENFRNPDFGDD